MADELLLFNVQYEEQGVITQKICNTLRETCICYSTRKVIRLQVEPKTHWNIKKNYSNSSQFKRENCIKGQFKNISANYELFG